jgi:hypothetical protein
MYLQKVIAKVNPFFIGILKATDEKSRIQIRNLVHGAKDLDPS